MSKTYLLSDACCMQDPVDESQEQFESFTDSNLQSTHILAKHKLFGV